MLLDCQEVATLANLDLLIVLITVSVHAERASPDLE